MTAVEGHRCDQCEEVELEKAASPGSRMGAPQAKSGWYVAAAIDANKDWYWFCSATCVVAYMGLLVGKR